MIIALDFDDTYTADPELWCEFVKMCRILNHKVILVTARDDTFVQRDYIQKALVNCDIDDIYLTSCAPKTTYMERQGITVDIWIDDHPERLVLGC